MLKLSGQTKALEPIREVEIKTNSNSIEGNERKQQQAAADSAGLVVAEQARFSDSNINSSSTNTNTTTTTTSSSCINDSFLSLEATPCKANNVVVESVVCLNDGFDHHHHHHHHDGCGDGEDGDDNNENKHHDYANIANINHNNNNNIRKNVAKELSLVQKPAQYQQHQLDEDQQQQQATSLYLKNYYHNKPNAISNNIDKKKRILKSALKRNATNYQILNANELSNCEKAIREKSIAHQLSSRPQVVHNKEIEFNFITGGENSRCNCSGRRRATLAGLIELFEQRICFDDTIESLPNNSNQQLLLKRISASKRNKTIKSKVLTDSYKQIKTRARLNKQQEEKMRNIITPVKYDPATTTTTSTSTSSEQEEGEQDEEAEEEEEEECVDSLEYDNKIKHDNNSHDDDDDEFFHGERDKKLHHVVMKGVPVLPQHNNYNNKRVNHKLTKKLIKTNWQPATNGSQYEQKLKPSVCHYQDNQQRFFIDSNKELLYNNKRTYSTNSSQTGVKGPPIVKHQPSSSKRLLNQLARLRKLNEPNYRIKRPEKVAQVEALIEQLERATSEWEEDELLLDRAERRDWPQKYYKLYGRKAEQQDNKLSKYNSQQLNQTQREEKEELEEEVKVEQELESLGPFGRRLDVDPIEAETIARSHSIINLQMMGSAQYKSGSSTWSSSSLNRARQARAFADRYFDDQAVRRLRRASLSSSLMQSQNNQSPYETKQYQSRISTPQNQSYQMSYLLCSNAYTPIIDSNTFSPYDTLDSRIRNDDLHYRNIRTKPEPNEPPFGIPRQEASANSHSVASHYLRRSLHRNDTNHTICSTCSCHYTQQNNDNHQHKRADSKVSFVNESGEAGRGSADSGVVGGGSTPLSASCGGRQSAASRLTLNSPVQYYSSRPNDGAASTSTSKQLCDSSSQTLDYGYALDYDDLAKEIDLDKEINRSNQIKSSRHKSIGEREQQDRLSSRCDSPMLEHYKAEILPKPMRRRPIINIEHPRAKSPLLRVSTKPLAKSTLNHSNDQKDGKLQTVKIQCYSDKPTFSSSYQSRPVSELECRYDFTDEDEDDDDNDNNVITNKPTRQIVTTNLDTSETNSEPNQSSIERLNYRGEPAYKTDKSVKTTTTNQPKTTNKNGPIFSIGEYKSINKPNLIIL